MRKLTNLIIIGSILILVYMGSLILWVIGAIIGIDFSEERIVIELLNKLKESIDKEAKVNDKAIKKNRGRRK